MRRRFTCKFIEIMRNSVDGWQRDNNPLKVSSKTEYDYDEFIGYLGEALDEIESLQFQLSEARARLAAFEEGFDPKEKLPKHISDFEDEIVVFEDKMGRFYIGFFDIGDKTWWHGASWLQTKADSNMPSSAYSSLLLTDTIKRWYPLPGRKVE